MAIVGLLEASTMHQTLEESAEDVVAASSLQVTGRFEILEIGTARVHSLQHYPRKRDQRGALSVVLIDL